MKETIEVAIDTLEATEVNSCGLSGNSCSTSSNNDQTVTITGRDSKFYKAAVKGKIDEFKGKGEEIETMLTPNKNTILHIHLTSSSVSETFVEEILHMCPTLLVKANAKGETLLHIAARYGHSIIVNKLIASLTKKTFIRAISDDTKDTALHEAVYFKHIKIVDMLTKVDPHISDLVNGDGETPLYVAIEREYWKVAQKILDNCKSPNQDGPNGRTALHAAVIRNKKEMVSQLLTTTSVNQADENGWVPLHLAALHGSTNVVKGLLNYDRDTAYKRDKKGRTALHLAAGFGHVKIIEKMIEYCPDCAELVDENGYNALHHTLIGGKILAKKAARLILDNPSLSNLYNQKDNNGNTPLHHVAITPKFRYYHPLLEVRSRVDTMAFNKQNQTAIDIVFDHTLGCEKKGYLVRRFEKIGAKNGERITIKKKVEDEEAHEHNSVADETNKESRRDKVRETNMIVATLIATVTFAAGFTMPGGFVQEHDQPDKASPILKYNGAFQIFVVMNTSSFVLSSSAVLAEFLSLYIERFDEYFLAETLILTILAMVSMLITFVTGTYAMLGFSNALLVAISLLVLWFFHFIFNWILSLFTSGIIDETVADAVMKAYHIFNYLNLIGARVFGRITSKN